MLIPAILAWLHIVSAISWLGGGIMFAFVIGPALAKLSPPSSGEFFVKVVPRVARFFQIMAGLTILFGVLLLYSLNPDSFIPSLSSFYGVKIMIGLSIGLLAFLVSEFVAVTPIHKAIRLIREMQASGQHQPPAELARTLSRVTITANLTVILLLLTSVFMVASAFY